MAKFLTQFYATPNELAQFVTDTLEEYGVHAIAEHPDGALGGIFRQGGADLGLEAGRQQALVGVLGGEAHLLRAFAARALPRIHLHRDRGAAR